MLIHCFSLNTVIAVTLQYCLFFLLYVIATISCDTKAALNYVRSLFRTEVFENSLPPIILHHQLYSIVHSRTVVDKELVRSGTLFFMVIFMSFLNFLTATIKQYRLDIVLIMHFLFLFSKLLRFTLRVRFIPSQHIIRQL